MTEQIFKGPNGVPVVDGGDCWKALGSSNVTKFNTWDVTDNQDRPTGVKYAFGMDRVVGKPRIAWITYPKSMYTIEEVTSADYVRKTMDHCQVCSFTEQLARKGGLSLDNIEQSTPQLAPLPVRPAASQQVEHGVERASLASLSGTIPKYGPALFRIAKEFALTDFGDMFVSLGASILLDLASGARDDPQYRRAMQALSDGAIDSMGGGNPDAAYFERAKTDAIGIMDAMRKDGAMAAFKTGMFKSRARLEQELKDSKAKADSQQQSPYSNPSTAYVYPSVSPMSPPRLFE